MSRDEAALADIPGTFIFTGVQCRRGYQLNQFCMSLNDPENRARFKENEAAYLAGWVLTDAQRRAVLERDWNAALAEGGNIYFLAKIFMADGKSFAEVASVMSGVTLDEYQAMMLSGGRSPEGCRSIRDRT